MAYKKISGKKTDSAIKPLDTKLLGQYMNCDTMHDVTITNIQVVSMGDMPNSAAVTFTNSFDEKHTENIFLWSTQEEDISFKLKNLISSIATDPEDLYDIIDHIRDHDWSIFSALSGRGLRLSLQRSAGYRILRTPRGIEAVEGDTTYGKYKDITELTEDMKTREIKRSYICVKEFHREEGKDDNKQKRQSFFDTVSCDNTDGAAAQRGDVGSEYSGTLPPTQRFF